MNILFLSTENPYPPDHGHHIRTLYVLKHLAQKHSVHFVGFVKNKHEMNQRKELEKICASVRLFLPPYCRNRLNFIIILLKSLLLLTPLQALRYNSKQAKIFIEQIIKDEKINAIHIDMIHLAIYRSHTGSVSATVTNHNVEYLRLKRWMHIEKNVLIKTFLFVQYRLMKKFEKSMCSKFDKCLVVSENDLYTLKNLNHIDNFALIPNGVDTVYFNPIGQRDRKGLIWTGSMESVYNRDAVSYFLKKVWPELNKRVPGIHATFVGKYPDDRFIDQFNTERVHFTGYVDDVRPYMMQNNIFIAPIRSGSGTKIKVLNALAMELPVVTTLVGAEGIDISEENGLFVCHDSQEQIKSIQRLWDHFDLALKLGKRGRRAVLLKYDWVVIYKKLDIVYTSLET
jgi:glycosyltransferase involved in cell wall biosynthesis